MECDNLPYKIYWDSSDKDVIRLEIAGHWTWQDYDLIVLSLIEMIETVPHRVDMIADLRDSLPPPIDDYSIQYIKRGRSMRPDNYGTTINVGTDFITKAILDAGVELVERNAKPRPLVQSIEEAYEALKEIRKEASDT